MTMQEKILDVLRRGGPQVSPKIAREVKGEAIIVSAYLSELKASGKLLISKIKIRTIPLYYLTNKKKQLALFADRLNPKDRAVFDKLEQLKVLREAQLDLLSKVALRKMKDFAIPLQVSVGGNQEIFWKWYMLDAGETNLIVSSLLQQVGRQDKVQEVSSEQLSTPITAKAVTTATAINTEQTIATQSNISVEPNVATKVAQDSRTIQTEKTELKNPWGSDYPPNTTVRGEAKVESVYPVNTATVSFEDTMQAQVVEVVNTADIDTNLAEDIELDIGKTEEIIENVKTEAVKIEEKNVEKEIPKTEEVKKEVASKTPEKKEKQKSLVEKLKDTFMPKHKGKAGDLLPQVESFFEQKKITIESSEVVRKNADLSLQILVPRKDVMKKTFQQLTWKHKLQNCLCYFYTQTKSQQKQKNS